MSEVAAIETARRELQAALAGLRSALARERVRPTDRDLREFESQALSGALGPDARELARRLRAGATTWAGVLDGTSPDSHLLRDHVERMVEVHGPTIRGGLSRQSLTEEDAER